MEKIKYCANCNSSVKKDDKYCKICGSKIGKGTYDPKADYMRCIYGPAPVERKYECIKCKYTFNTFLMVDKTKYCPKCGGKLIRHENDLPI